MVIQAILTVLLVTACSLYTVWTLMPSAARRALARSLALSSLPLPDFIAKRLLRAATAKSGCGGCSHSAANRKNKKAAPHVGGAAR